MPWDLFEGEAHAAEGATHHFSLAREVSEHYVRQYTLNLGSEPSLFVGGLIEI